MTSFVRLHRWTAILTVSHSCGQRVFQQTSWPVMLLTQVWWHQHRWMPVTFGDSDTDSVATVVAGHVQHDDFAPIVPDTVIDALERDLRRAPSPHLRQPCVGNTMHLIWSPELRLADAGVVLIPASPEGTPWSRQDVQSSLLCNKFAVLAGDNVHKNTKDLPTALVSSGRVNATSQSRASESEEREEGVALTGIAERADAIPVPLVPHVHLNAEEGLNNPTSDAEGVDDDE